GPRSSSCASTPTSPPRSSRRCATVRARRRSPRRVQTLKRTSRTAEPSGDPYDAAVRYLGGRPHTVAEIHRHLRGKRFDADAIDHAIDRLRAQRYVDDDAFARWRSEEHTSELQSPYDLVCRPLLEKKNCAQQYAGL